MHIDLQAVNGSGPGEQVALLPLDEAIQLFDLHGDPGERANVAAAQPEVRDRLVGELSAHRDRPQTAWGASAPVSIDRLNLELLRALGYIVK